MARDITLRPPYVHRRSTVGLLTARLGRPRRHVSSLLAKCSFFFGRRKTARFFFALYGGYRSRKMLKNEYSVFGILIAEICFDTAENEPLKIWRQKFLFFNPILTRSRVFVSGKQGICSERYPPHSVAR